jgi:thioredoxin
MISLVACSGKPGAQTASANLGSTVETAAALDAGGVDVNDQESAADAAVSSNEETTGKKKHGTVKLTKADFLVKVMNYEKNQAEWVFEGDKPALVDFYADWCGPCRITSPILEELAVEYGDKIDIYKIDTDVEQELAAVFGIRGLPSFLFIPMEGKPTMSSGIAQTPEETKQMFRNQIDELLLN